MSILNIGARALQANETALKTTGNNIANVNTPGYSRQSVVLNTVAGQYTGGGYIGKGVEITSIQRNFDAFLTRQSTMASSVQSADVMRAEKLKQLGGIFEGGPSGLGAAISDMLNAFTDVASAPSDLTARTVVLTRIDETAARMRSASQSLDDLQRGVVQEIQQKVAAINSLAYNIADLNKEIARASAAGQPPNDMLDRRDQLVRNLNQYVQTSSVAADDGSINLFVGGSQALVLGSTVAPLELVDDEFGNPLNKLVITRSGQQFMLDENNLGGGEVSGLLRFQNTDLAEGRNLLGRLTLAVTQTMNDQHQLGLDLDGKPGGILFNHTELSDKNVRASKSNTGSGILTPSISDPTKFIASDYEVNFTASAAGTVTRLSDGKVVHFPQTPPTTAPILVTLDGLNISLPSGTPAVGDRFLIQPFSTSASNVSSAFSSPRALAVASPVAGTMGTGNTGSLQQVSLTARSNPVSATPVVLTFTGPNSYTRSDELPTPNATAFAFTPGQVIEGTTPTAAPLSQWSLTLQGTPQAGDTFTVGRNAYPTLNAGNANAMMDLRDLAAFDGGPLTDGFAGLMSQIGIRTQSAVYAAKLSSSIASNLETSRTGISGVNLDEEAAKLLQYQQAYQASAKVIQIAQGIFDTLIQSLGR